MSATSTVNKGPSSMKPNDAKITPMTLIPGPSTATTTKGSIIEINSKPAERDNKHLTPMEPTSQPPLPTPPMSRQPLLVTPPASANSTPWLFTRLSNYVHPTVPQVRNNIHPYFADHLHECLQWAILQHHIVNSQSAQDHTCTSRKSNFQNHKYQYIYQL